jgi:hypothetical protein
VADAATRVTTQHWNTSQVPRCPRHACSVAADSSFPDELTVSGWLGLFEFETMGYGQMLRGMRMWP